MVTAKVKLNTLHYRGYTVCNVRGIEKYIHYETNKASSPSRQHDLSMTRVLCTGSPMQPLRLGTPDSGKSLSCAQGLWLTLGTSCLVKFLLVQQGCLFRDAYHACNAPHHAVDCQTHLSSWIAAFTFPDNSTRKKEASKSHDALSESQSYPFHSY